MLGAQHNHVTTALCVIKAYFSCNMFMRIQYYFQALLILNYLQSEQLWSGN